MFISPVDEVLIVKLEGDHCNLRIRFVVIVETNNLVLPMPIKLSKTPITNMYSILLSHA